MKSGRSIKKNNIRYKVIKTTIEKQKRVVEFDDFYKKKPSTGKLYITLWRFYQKLVCIEVTITQFSNYTGIEEQ